MHLGSWVPFCVIETATGGTQEYTELSGVNLSSLLVAGNVSTALMVCILLLVYLGNEARAPGTSKPLVQ